MRMGSEIRRHPSKRRQRHPSTGTKRQRHGEIRPFEQVVRLLKKSLDQSGKPRLGGRESGFQEIRDALGKLPGNN
jgi:hypothetical protein